MYDIRDDASHASSFSFDTMNLNSPGLRDRRIEDERFVEERVGVVLRLQFDKRIEAEMSDHRDDESVNSMLTYQQPCATFNGAHSEQVVRSVQEQVPVPYQQPCATSNGAHSEQNFPLWEIRQHGIIGNRIIHHNDRTSLLTRKNVSIIIIIIIIILHSPLFHFLIQLH
jgi:hypothetical protein